MTPMARPVVALVCLQAIVLTACAHLPLAPVTQASQPPASAADHSQLVLIVGSARSQQMLSGVKVTLLARDGSEVDLGTTDSLGRLAVQKAFLRERGAKVILFSTDHFFTGAIRIDDSKLSYDELYIQLAALAML